MELKSEKIIRENSKNGKPIEIKWISGATIGWNNFIIRAVWEENGKITHVVLDGYGKKIPHWICGNIINIEDIISVQNLEINNIEEIMRKMGYENI